MGVSWTGGVALVTPSDVRVGVCVSQCREGGGAPVAARVAQSAEGGGRSIRNLLLVVQGTGGVAVMFMCGRSVDGRCAIIGYHLYHLSIISSTSLHIARACCTRRTIVVVHACKEARGRNSRSGRIDDDEGPTRRPGGESAEPSSRPERSSIQSDTAGAGGSSSTMTRPRAVMNQEGFPR
eukprot:scaffold17207_cov119-Isochrysis_galbana.AAC.1